MRAVVVHGADDLRVDQRPDPVPGPGEVLDRDGVGRRLRIRPRLLAPRLLRHRRAAAAPGARARGRRAGSPRSGQRTALEVGHPVTVHPAELVGDGHLPERIAGRTNLYPRIRYFGSAAFDPHTDGGFSELRVVRAEQIRPLPDGVSTEHGALAEPLAVALHAVHRAGDVTGRDVVVNGAGPSGRWSWPPRSTAARPRSWPPTCPTPRWRSPRPWARTRSATWPPADTLPEDAELVFEASGAPAALGDVLRATARGGTLVQVGNLPGTAVSAVLGDLVTREITWVGAYRFVEEISDALRRCATVSTCRR